MAFGLPYPRSEASRNYSFGQAELAANAESALRKLGWQYEILFGAEFRARVPATVWSWRHQFKINITADGEVRAESKSAGGELFFDLRRNKNSIETFFSFFEHCLKQTDSPDSASTAKQPSAEPNKLATLCGGCLLSAIVLFFSGYVLFWFFAAVVGLATGNLYLMQTRGAPAVTIHGTPARILSAIILAVFLWILLRIRQRRRQSR